jgi:hypothetical protein
MAIESRISLVDPVRIDLTVIEPEDVFTLTRHILPWLRDPGRPGFFLWYTRPMDDYQLPPEGFDRFDYRFEFSDRNLALEFKMTFG